MGYYIRFMLCLTTGIAGVCMVLKTLLDTLFADWDIWQDVLLLINHPAVLRHPERRVDYQALLAASHQTTARIEGKNVPRTMPAAGTVTLAPSSPAGASH